MKSLVVRVVCAAVFGLAASAASAQTLNTIKQRGSLNCGSNGTLAGFGLPDLQGRWAGLDVDFCKALAAAIFNDPTKVKFVPLTAKDRFTALQSGEVDVLARNTTWTSSRDTSLGLNFTVVNYYDGQGFMVRKSLKLNSALELGDAAVCVQQGTTTELNLADYFRANKMKLKTVTFATATEAVKAYDAGRCDAYTTDASGLAGERLRLAQANDHIILQEIISKEPLGPAVRHGDDQWFDIVKWTHYAMVNAEELGITQGQCRRPEEIGQSGRQASARQRGQAWRGARPVRRLGLPHHQARRQLRRGVRAQRRPGLDAEDRAGAERAVEQGRAAIRAVGALSAAHGRGRAHETEGAADLQPQGPRHGLSGRAVRGDRVPGVERDP